MSGIGTPIVVGSAQAVILAPSSSTRNVIQPTGNFKPLIVRGAAGQTQNLQEWQDSTEAVLAKVSKDGGVIMRGDVSTIYNQAYLVASPGVYKGITFADIAADGRIKMGQTDSIGASSIDFWHGGAAIVLTNVSSSDFIAAGSPKLGASSSGSGGSTALVAKSTGNGTGQTIDLQTAEHFGADANVQPILRIGARSFSFAVLPSGSRSWSTVLPGTTVLSIDPFGIATHSISDAVTNAVTNALVVDHASTGTPTIGFGTGIQIQGQSSANPNRAMARARASWVEATDATRKARLTLSAFDTVERDGVVVEASGTVVKLGFFSQVGTPVIQPATTGETVGFTAGGGTNVTDASTFTGNVGATAYRLSDVVKHLKNLGLLAA